MAQAIVDAAPAATQEITVTTTWPSICRYRSGAMLGRLFAVRWPNIYIFKLGNLLALLAIPWAVVLYFARLVPGLGRHYWLTNRRVVVRNGLWGGELRAVGLDRFESIRIEVRSGQEWFDAGDLVFLEHGNEVFRLEAVSRPEPFCQTCLKSRQAYVSVHELIERQAARA